MRYLILYRKKDVTATVMNATKITYPVIMISVVNYEGETNEYLLDLECEDKEPARCDAHLFTKVLISRVTNDSEEHEKDNDCDKK